jgi:histone H3/H4
VNRERLVPVSAVERLAKKAGAERIGKDALEEISSVLEDYAHKVAVKSVKYARYAKRSTIKREDIELAASE